MLTTETLLQISKEVGAPVSRVEATISLLEGGATVPFIARYRKEATGNLSDEKVQNIDERRAYYTALDLRRETILSSIERQGKLTEELKQKILLSLNRHELEDLYLPFKPRRRTKAGAALERGLGPLADYIWEQSGSEPVEIFAFQFVMPVEAALEPDNAGTDPSTVEPLTSSGIAETEVVPDVAASAEVGVEAADPPESAADGSVSDTTVPAPPEAAPSAIESPSIETQAGSLAPVAVDEPTHSVVEAEAQSEAKTKSAAPPVTSVEQAIEGALHILAERIAENPDYRKQLRDRLMKTGVVRAHVAPGKESEKTKYEMYYKFEELVARIPSHRMLAIRRGTRENILTYTIEADGDEFVKGVAQNVIRDPESQFAPFLERAIRDGYDRLLAPSIQTEVRSVLRERSESEAIDVFEDNLRTLLLSPPAGPIPVMGIDPGIRTGCKIAVVDETGKFVENHTIHVTEPHKDLEAAEKALTDLIQKHNVKAITIGNGTASRETEGFVRSIVQKTNLDAFVVVVNEAGASVYSASRRARAEFPHLDVTVRGAISIARRLQDPLAELVKIEPRSIGVGQYQHDVDQRKLKQSLEAAVQSCVNRVGVDLNTASQDLLKYVAGINEKLASNIIEQRDRAGKFSARIALMEIEGFGEKTFEQAAGFLRIKDGDNPLDRTAVHPESYPVVERMAASLGCPVADVIENPERVHALDFKSFEGEAGRFTLLDIREELLKPGRDPRDKFVAPRFRDDVKDVVDLQEGMELEGSVTNVTNFGAFVDLGVHQDGLVHISELSHRYVQDAREAVKVGDVVKVKVIGVDKGMKRISLSMKALVPKPPRPVRKRKRRPEKEGVRQDATAPVAAAIPAPDTPEHAKPAPPPRKPRPAPVATMPKHQQPQSKRPEKPAPPRAPESMEEKIRALQEKFGRVG